MSTTKGDEHSLQNVREQRAALIVVGAAFKVGIRRANLLVPKLELRDFFAAPNVGILLTAVALPVVGEQVDVHRSVTILGEALGMIGTRAAAAAHDVAALEADDAVAAVSVV